MRTCIAVLLLVALTARDPQAQATPAQTAPVQTAETPEQVRPMLVEALQHNGPALVEVVVNRQELSMPPTIQLDQMMGFSLYMIKAVLDGRGTKILDLAKTNLLRNL